MDCPRCGSAGFTPEIPCKDCGYGMPDDTVIRVKSDADMSLDELNRMLGELGIEPISDVGHGIGEGTVADPVMSAGMRAGRTDLDDAVLPLALETVTGVEETVQAEEIGEMEETARPDKSEEIGEMEETARPDEPEEIGEMEETARPDQPEEIGQMEETEVLVTPARKSAASKQKLKDARHAAKPALAVSNLLKALIGWLPALHAGWRADRRKQPAVGIANSDGESDPNSGSEPAQNSGGESARVAEESILSEPSDQDGSYQKDNSRQLQGEPDEGMTDLELEALLNGPRPMGDGKNPTAERVSMPEKEKRKKVGSLSAGMKNLIFRITVPLFFVLLVVVLLQFVLGLRERRMEPDLPSEPKEWRYEPWSPEADVPPVPVTVEAADGVYLP